MCVLEFDFEVEMPTKLVLSNSKVGPTRPALLRKHYYYKIGIPFNLIMPHIESKARLLEFQNLRNAKSRNLELFCHFLFRTYVTTIKSCNMPHMSRR